jgi:hypothetical protein
MDGKAEAGATDPDGQTETPHGFLEASASAARHASMLFVLWLIVVLAKFSMGGAHPGRTLNSPGRLAYFLLAFAVADALIIAYWPKMAQSFSQAGVIFVATFLFACVQQAEPGKAQ